MRDKRKMEDLLPEELDAEIKRCPIVGELGERLLNVSAERIAAEALKLIERNLT